MVDHRGTAFLIGTCLRLRRHVTTQTLMHPFISPIFSCAEPNAVQLHHGMAHPPLAILEGTAGSKVQGLRVPNGRHGPVLMGMLRVVSKALVNLLDKC